MEYQFPFTAISRSGETRVFEDAKSFLEWFRDTPHVGAFWYEGRLGWSRRKGLTKLTGPDHLGWSTVAVNEWVVRDLLGRPVDCKKVDLPPGQTLKPRIINHAGIWGVRRYQRDKATIHAIENGMPVPGCGKPRGKRSSKSWTKNGRNGSYNRSKGLKLYEDAKLRGLDFDEF